LEIDAPEASLAQIATDREYRQQCLQAFADHKALDFMFDHVKAAALRSGKEN